MDASRLSACRRSDQIFSVEICRLANTTRPCKCLYLSTVSSTFPYPQTDGRASRLPLSDVSDYPEFNEDKSNIRLIIQIVPYVAESIIEHLFAAPLSIANIASPCPRVSAIGLLAPTRQDLSIVSHCSRYRAL